MNETLLAQLNDAQRQAALHFTGPALVIAGAGSGKTRTVVHRIAYLMAEQEVLPQQILAVTFTNKAAGELKERVQALIGDPARNLWVSTFHSACLRVLRNYGELISLQPGFAIYDNADQLDVLQEVQEQLKLEANPRLLRALVDRAKSQLWTPADLAEQGEAYFGTMVAGLPISTVADAYRLYQQRLHALNAVDFNDILMRCVDLFARFPEVLDKVQQRAVFIHVDEYQDTNAVQYRLTQQLANKYNNLMVVGDPDQSIYGFRGANVRNILDFSHDYRDSVVYRLELNYRSVASVLELANCLIRQNQERLDKELRPVKASGDKVKRYSASDGRAEADFVARQISRLLAEAPAQDSAPDGVQGLNDFAVLYRTNAQSRVLEEALRRAGIAAKIVGGVGFYERREVKDILSYARAAINPDDDIAIKRVLNRPKRGIGKTSEENLMSWARQAQQPLFQALQHADELLRGTPAAARVQDFVAMLEELRDAALSLPAGQFLRFCFERSDYLAALKREKSYEAQARLENLEELLNAVVEWEQEQGGSMAEFLDEAALLASVDDRAVQAVNSEVPEQAVTLMTLHNAKGLEFPVVFLVGLEENLIPHRSSLSSLQEIEEERRLLYVGITRAQEKLFLVHCESRMTYGRSEFARPSRFLEDIPRDMLEDIDLLGTPLGQQAANHYARQWRPPSASAASAPDAAPNAATNSAGKGLRGGEKVRHPKFGQGTVVGLSGEGSKTEVTVVFEGVGAKRLLLKYANLHSLES